jgi:hypothetical protein
MVVKVKEVQRKLGEEQNESRYHFGAEILRE